jgi:hypothetical protein
MSSAELPPMMGLNTSFDPVMVTTQYIRHRSHLFRAQAQVELGAAVFHHAKPQGRRLNPTLRF